MTDIEFDNLLRRLILDQAALEWEREKAQVEAMEFAPSLGYRLSIRAMLRNPAKWYRSRCRAPWQRVARAVASILLAIFVTLATITVVSPTTCALVKNWLMEWYTEHVYYSFTDEVVQGDPADYELTYIPEGYVEVGRVMAPARKTVQYQNDAGEMLKFECQTMKGVNATALKTNDLALSETNINGHPGELYMSTNNNVTNNLIWHDSALNLQFAIYGFIKEETLINMAQSVKPY